MAERKQTVNYKKSKMIFSKTLILLLIFLSYTLPIFSQDNDLIKICDSWNKLDEKIKTKVIDKDEALELLQKYENKIISSYERNNGQLTEKKDWVFPLKYFTSIYYRENGNDYRLKKYDYFQGSDSKGHPAHDIMILDGNKDLLDDSTFKPVDVVSMSSGVIVATDTTWEPGSTLRGGKYVKVFDVANKGIFYYSHLSKVIVKPGDILIAGDKIAEVGRTGRKAILKDGKTHLHIAFLKSEDGYPIPEDIINDLRNAESKIKDYR